MILPNAAHSRALPVELTKITQPELRHAIQRAIDGRHGTVITYATAHTLVGAWRSPEFASVIDATDLCYADGAGVVVADRLIEGVGLRKVTANAFFVPFAVGLIQDGKRVALIGGKNGIADEVGKRLKLEMRNRGDDRHGEEVVFCHSGYMSAEEETRLVEHLQAWDPHIVFVGMGQPRQEQWALQIGKALPSTVFHCVGGLFDYVSGRISHPPTWVRDAGLEWLFRLVDRPKETWRRYLFGLPSFAIHTVRAALRRSPRASVGGERRHLP